MTNSMIRKVWAFVIVICALALATQEAMKDHAWVIIPLIIIVIGLVWLGSDGDYWEDCAQRFMKEIEQRNQRG